MSLDEISFLESETNAAVFFGLDGRAKESLDCWSLGFDFLVEEGGLNPGAKGAALAMIVAGRVDRKGPGIVGRLTAEETALQVRSSRVVNLRGSSFNRHFLLRLFHSML